METEVKQNEVKEQTEQFRVVITKEASKILEDLLVKATDGFDGGHITKSDVANSIIMDAEKTFTESDIRLLRQIHFDEKRMLAALLKSTKSQNELPETLKSAIKEHFGLIEVSKRGRPKDQSV